MPPMPEVLDIAVIGAGSRAERHLDTLSRMTDRFRLSAVCDAREERRTWAGETYRVPTFDNPLALFDRAKPHAIAVIIPPDAHHLVTAAAARRGVHVLSETPMATTLAMCDDMIASARKHNVVLEISENVWRYAPERLKRLAVDAGLIGDVQQVHLWYRSGSYHGISALRRFLTARPTRVLGLSRSFRVAPVRDLDGSVQRQQTWECAAIDFDGGGLGLYQLPVGSDRGNLWEVVGSEGAIMGTDLVLFDGPNAGRRRIPMETIAEEIPDPSTGAKTLIALRFTPGQGRPPVEWQNPYRRYAASNADDVARADIYTAFHETITAGKGTPETPTENGWPAALPTEAAFYGPENGRADMELLMATRESDHRGNTWLDLPLPKGDDTEFERRVHAAFEQTYGAAPFSDPEALLSKLFPRRGVAQSLGGVIA